MLAHEQWTVWNLEFGCTNPRISFLPEVTVCI